MYIVIHHISQDNGIVQLWELSQVVSYGYDTLPIYHHHGKHTQSGFFVRKDRNKAPSSAVDSFSSHVWHKQPSPLTKRNIVQR